MQQDANRLRRAPRLRNRFDSSQAYLMPCRTEVLWASMTTISAFVTSITPTAFPRWWSFHNCSAAKIDAAVSPVFTARKAPGWLVIDFRTGLISYAPASSARSVMYAS